MRILGIILIAAGILMLVFKGFNYTQDKKIVDIGPLEINKQEKKTVNWPMYAGGITVIAGVVLVFAGKSKNAA